MHRIELWSECVENNEPQLDVDANSDRRPAGVCLQPAWLECSVSVG